MIIPDKNGWQRNRAVPGSLPVKRKPIVLAPCANGERPRVSTPAAEPCCIVAPRAGCVSPIRVGSFPPLSKRAANPENFGLGNERELCRQRA